MPKPDLVRPDKHEYASGNANVTDAVFQRATVQMMVYEECLTRLNAGGMFRKADILASLGLEDVADRIWWEQILKRLKAGFNAFTDGKNYSDQPVVELYPVVERFFRADADAQAKQAIESGIKTIGREWDDSWPAHYLAGGYGKKTAGWVLAHHANGRFAIHRTDMDVRRISGLKNRIAAQARTVMKEISDTNNVRSLAQKAGIPVPKKIGKTP
jgi:hypothetical protein